MPSDAAPTTGDPPLLTVVVPTFERVDVLERAVASVLAQEAAAFELLVVDDGSTDDTLRRLSLMRNPRLRVLGEPHRGVSGARNAGIRHARGSIVTFLDSDDEALPGWLAALTRGFAGDDVGIVCCGARILSQRGRRVTGDEVRLPRRGGPLHHHQPILYLAGTLAVRRHLLLEIGGFREELSYAENAELAMRLVPACLEAGLRIEALEAPLVLYRRQVGAWSSHPERFRSKREAAEMILELHGPRMHRELPRGYANYRAVAGINAARLGDLAAARRHLSRAIGAVPFHWKNYLRWALTWVPPLARHLWLREAEEGAP
jgi:glycosyltransferase involved in cell wall biosynthesis